MFWNITPCNSLKVYLLHGVTCQKAEIFIISNVRTSNPTKMNSLREVKGWTRTDKYKRRRNQKTSINGINERTELGKPDKAKT
jgi:hypothetical protein